MLKQALNLGKNIITKQQVKQLQGVSKFSFGNDQQNNQVTQKFDTMFENNWHYKSQDDTLSEWTHKSNAEQYINKVPVIEVDQPIVRCMGGTEINAGHPQVYIQLDTRTPGQVQACKYCGLKFTYKHHH